MKKKISHLSILLIIICLILASSSNGYAQLTPLVYRKGYDVRTTFTPYNPIHHVNGKTRAGIFNVNYTDNSLSVLEKSAIEYAVSLWEDALSNSIPIKINIKKAILPSFALAQTFPNDVGINFATIHPKYKSNTYFPSALHNHMTSFDNYTNPVTGFDIDITIGDIPNWYTGSDGNAAPNQYDLVSTVLHEIAHGLGVYSTANYDGTNYRYGYLGYPLIHETFVISSPGGNFLTSYSSPSPSLNSFMASTHLFYGLETYIANNNVDPKLEDNTPVPYIGISELSFVDYPNELLRSSGPLGAGMHDITAVTVGIMNDIGWDCLIPVGLEDHINITNSTYNNPDISLDLNYNYTYKMQFIDNAPYGDFLQSGFQNWTLKLLHNSGSIIIASQLNSPSPFIVNINSIPTGYEWLRDANGQIRGELTANGIDNDNIAHSKTIEVGIKYQPNDPIIGLGIFGGNNNCANVKLSFYAKGATNYAISSKVSGVAMPWFSHGTFSDPTEIIINGLDETLNYDFRVEAQNNFGWATKIVTRTKCTFPIVLSPNPAHDNFEITSLTSSDLIKTIDIIDMTSGQNVKHISLNVPLPRVHIDISDIEIGNYIINVSSPSSLTATGKLTKIE